MILALFCGLVCPSTGAQSSPAAPPNLYRLQQQVITLTARIDSTGYVITAALLLPIAIACLVLWWNARRFPAFGSVGLYLAADRTCAVAVRSAEEIAKAAQTFGQQDDVTVLTLQFAPAEVAYA